jgi:tetratricopeptide (TPR) repeat protein
VLLDAVVQQLRNLASYVDTELRPPVVILDSKKSGDGQDVLATFGVHPNMPEGPINYVQVQSGNGRFRSLGVRPGDILKFSHVRYDLQSMETDIGETVTLDLTVAQVINDKELLVEGGLNQPVLLPQKVEIWRYVDDRLDEITRQLATYIDYRQPIFDWEPSGDERALKQIVERLNQWMQQSQPKVEWSAAESLATLDPAVANDDRLAPLISAEALADPVFQPYEGRLLQEAVWLRDISRWAQGESFDDVTRATALFDWTVRNIQLDADASRLPNRPWQVLVYGHGTAEKRAWVFALLCRQQGLDVVVASVPGRAQPQAEGSATTADASQGEPSFWLPALLSEGQLYLFDTRLGLPIPGPNGQGVATLEAVQADESLLRQLDSEDDAYRVSAEQLRRVTANVVAGPFDLSRRAQALQTKLSGDDRLVLTSRADELAGKLAAVSAIADVRMWGTPFETWRDQLRIPIAVRRQWALAFEPFARRPTLWKARVLHFQGHRPAEGGAPPDLLAEFADDHNQAVQLYTSRAVRPPDRAIATLTSESEQRIYSTAKQSASYWVGLLLFDAGKYASAENWFANPKLAAAADDPWASGTRYNLARTYEAEGKIDEAIALYEQDTSPQRHGNRLRARWLRTKQAKPPAAD